LDTMPSSPRLAGVGEDGCAVAFFFVSHRHLVDQLTTAAIQHHGASRPPSSRQLLPDGAPQLQADTMELAPVLLGSVSGNEAEDGVAAELTADLGQNHERVGLDLALTVFTNVVLHVGLEVIGMI